jgi:hypothetical protein
VTHHRTDKRGGEEPGIAGVEELLPNLLPRAAFVSLGVSTARSAVEEPVGRPRRLQRAEQRHVLGGSARLARSHRRATSARRGPDQLEPIREGIEDEHPLMALERGIDDLDPGIGYIASTAHERNRKRLEERAAAAK